MPDFFDHLAGTIPVALAPMSGVTDTPFRRLTRAFGASMLVSEMIASERYARGDAEEDLKGAEDTVGEPYVVQLAGCEPEWMAEAARKAEAGGAAVVDINMGCPAKRVVGGYAGSALMRDLDHAARLIDAVTSAVTIPVTVKMRLGWDHHSINAPDLAYRAQTLGVRLVSVHGRTRCQFYEGQADWDAVAAVVARVTIPVLVNGDISSVEDARTALARSGAQGVMIGRAAVGRPWLIGEIGAAVNGLVYRAPSPSERKAAILEHLQASLQAYGTRKGLLVFRKHLAAYLTGEGCDRSLVKAACQEGSAAAVELRICQAFSGDSMAEAA